MANSKVDAFISKIPVPKAPFVTNNYEVDLINFQNFLSDLNLYKSSILKFQEISSLKTDKCRVYIQKLQTIEK